MLLNTVVKEEEKRVFFEIGGRPPRDGEERERLTLDQEKGEALIAKEKWEQKNGHRLLNFHYDPYAFGLRPLQEPKGQVVKSGAEKDIMGNVIGIIPSQNYSRETTKMRSVGGWTGEWL